MPPKVQNVTIPQREAPEATPASPPISPLYRVDSKYLQDGSVRNPNIKAVSRAFFAVVGKEGTSSNDYTIIQEAINKARDAGGGNILVKKSLYKLNKYLTLYDNVSLIGEDPEQTILDFSGAGLATNESAIFAGGIFVTSTGDIDGATGSTTVTGTATDFTDAGVKEDDTIYINSHPYSVCSVTSNTSLELKEPWRGPDFGDTAFAIMRPKRNMFVENMTIQHNLSGTGLGGVLFVYCEKVGARQVKVKNFSGQGFTITDSFNFIFKECEARNCLTGFQVQAKINANRVSNGSIINCSAWGNSSRGINVSVNCQTRIIGCTANGNVIGIRAASSETIIQGCHVEFNSLDGVRVVDVDECIISGNDTNSNGEVGISLLISGGNPENNVVTGNTISLNGIYGIYVDGSENVVVGNTGDLADYTSGVYLTANSDNCAVTGNVLDGSSRTSNVGIEIITGGDNSAVVGNVITAVTTALIDGAAGTKVAHNIGVATHTT